MYIVKDAKCRIWVMSEKLPVPQPKLLSLPQLFPNPPVAGVGDDALCQDVTGECMHCDPHHNLKVCSWV